MVARINKLWICRSTVFSLLQVILIPCQRQYTDQQCKIWSNMTMLNQGVLSHMLKQLLNHFLRFTSHDFSFFTLEKVIFFFPTSVADNKLTRPSFHAVLYISFSYLSKTASKAQSNLHCCKYECLLELPPPHTCT